MQPKLLEACKEQMSKMGPPLAAAGPIKTLTFVKADQTRKRTETYKVTFEKGKPETWLIGGLKNGKFAALLFRRRAIVTFVS